VRGGKGVNTIEVDAVLAHVRRRAAAGGHSIGVVTPSRQQADALENTLLDQRGGGMPRLIPELICADLQASLVFYRLLGFRTRYERPEERFAYLERDGAHLMLEQPATQDRLYPRATLEHPYGRGVNITVDVDDVDAIHAAVLAAGHELYLPMEERWYGRSDDAVGVRQFAVPDPDGYLMRISERIGTRPVTR
jgi:lactoylglutathione lyase